MNVRVAPEAASPTISLRAAPPASALILPVLLSISAVHLINDLIQALLPAMYPLFKADFALSFGQVGLLAFVFQAMASLLQPVVGAFTDRRPLPYSLPFGMVVSLAGVFLLSRAGSFAVLVLAAGMVGVGSAVFHPEASRVARMASGGRHGLAQSVFQVGGNGGQAMGPLLAAFIVMPYGQANVAWFCVLGVLGVFVLARVGRWYAASLAAHARAARVAPAVPDLSRGRVTFAVGILLLLIFSKYFYLTSLTTYYTFYLIDRFGVPIQTAQIYLFVFLGSVAVGTLLGGPIGDRIGRKYVIWASILGVLPFTLVLPHVNLFWTVALTVPIGLILASAFSAILVYAQELMPNRIGTVAGLFYGFGFGMAGIGAAVLGEFADHVGIETVYQICAYLPAIGIMTALLPNLERPRHAV